MSARKLQQEMERVFKRVLEGTAVFDQIYDKLQNSANQSQKEKLEADLKKELKKLQKLRDQIKTWIGSNDVRDKKQLIEQRRLIENEMERFKVVEREIKQKTWQTSPEDDPHFEEKKVTCDFLLEQIDSLEEQTDELEQEEESLQSSRKGKKDQAKQERIAEIEHHVERNKWHIHSMENMIRMIENDTLAPESVDELRDDILYYVESNQEVDFAEDEAIYDDLGLVEDDDEDVAETIVRDDTYTLEDLAQDLSKEREEKSKEEKKDVKRKPTTGSSASSTPAPPSAPSTPISSAQQTRSTPLQPPPMNLASTSGPALVSAVPASPVTTPMPASAAGLSRNSTPTPAPAPGLTHSSAPAASTMPIANPAAFAQHQASAPPAAQGQSPAPSAPVARQVPAALGTGELPSCIADLTPALNALKERNKNPDKSTLASWVDVSYLHCPDAVMADRPRYYYAESPYPTPDYYPCELLASLDDPKIFATMDLDTLFYVFYYRQGSYQQYLAAKELKSRSWRFHKRFLTWFQRHEDPKTINPEFEQGTYRFFDFEGSWLQRRKSNFKFEYQYLEDET